MKILMIVLGIAYPLIAHAAVVSHSEWLTLASLAVLAALAILPRLRRGSLLAWGALPVIVGALILLARADLAWLPLYAPPVFINLFMAWVFGHTLAGGRVPLIERIVRLLHAPDEDLGDIPRYARRLTLAWTVLFIALALLNLVLALCAVPGGILLLLGIDPPVAVPLATWSLFANLLNYLIVGAFFLGEYAYRQHRFPQQPYRNLFDFIRRAAAVGPRVVGSLRS